MKVTLARASLVIDQRWAVGRVPSAAEAIHLPVVVDPRGGVRRPYVPATGLAGALRPHLGPLADEWLGPEPPDWEEAGQTRERRLGRLVLQGTFVESTDDTKSAVERRGVTSIDPNRRAAHGGGLRTEEWNRPGTISVAMLHEGEADTALLDKLASWTPTVGRAASTGMGAARVGLVEHLTLNLDDVDQFTWWMNDRNAWLLRMNTAEPPVEVVTLSPAGAARSDVAGPIDSERSIEIEWVVKEPLHIGVDDFAKDAPTGRSQVQPTMAVDDDPLVPGSSWKGVIRGRVENILAITGAPRSSELLEYLFGSSESGRGLLSFYDSLIELSSIPGGKLLNRTHVAIDRFTGGARDSGLFAVEAIPAGTPVTLIIRSEHAIPEAVRDLLRHVFQDIHDGLIGVGGMVTRGYGGLEYSVDQKRRFSGEQERPAPIDTAGLVALLKPVTGEQEDGENQ